MQNTQYTREQLPHFAWDGKSPRIHELRTFGFCIFPIKSQPKSYMTGHNKYH